MFGLTSPLKVEQSRAGRSHPPSRWPTPRYEQRSRADFLAVVQVTLIAANWPDVGIGLQRGHAAIETCRAPGQLAVRSERQLLLVVCVDVLVFALLAAFSSMKRPTIELQKITNPTTTRVTASTPHRRAS